ncbi:uncharacterized protein LOC142225824 isoform X2 [Haematobia irritans]|uniref:uncharacterized protein LOC142225824 isoform X2 n=1 Tax=Haematobia irritans TaxID=7368 RepID=UPI003F502023
MGKAQSKRSVDITTEGTKSIEENLTEKMEKIEDVDMNGVNVESSVKSLSEKDATLENEKDLATEKTSDRETSGENANDIKSTTSDSKQVDDNTEEISPLTDENSVKKSKKEKVKKKWSFRSISFGKKDKQKPGKSEDAIENTSAVINGTKDKASADDEESSTEQQCASNTDDGTPQVENLQNGDVTEIESHSNKKDEKSGAVKQSEDNSSTNSTKNDIVTDDDSAPTKSQEAENSPPTGISDDDLLKKENQFSQDESNATEEVIEEVEVSKEIASVEEENKDIAKDVQTSSVSTNGAVDETNMNGCNDINDLNEKDSTEQTEVQFQNLNISSSKLLEGVVESNAQDHIPCLSNESDNEINEFAVRKVEDGSSPPPLPISPPPSQVTVFAFTNNGELADNSIQKSELNNTELEVVNLTNRNSPNSVSPMEETCNTEKEQQGNYQTSEQNNLESLHLLNKEADEKSADEYTEIKEEIIKQSSKTDSNTDDEKFVDEKNEVKGFSEESDNSVNVVSEVLVMETRDESLLIQDRCGEITSNKEDMANKNVNITPNNSVESSATSPMFTLNDYGECKLSPEIVNDNDNEELKTDSLVGEEHKIEECSNPIGLKESATTPEIKEDTSVSCE